MGDDEAKQWVRYFLGLAPDDQERLAARVLDAARRSDRCITEMHVGYVDQLRQEMRAEHPVCHARQCECTACVQHLARRSAR